MLKRRLIPVLFLKNGLIVRSQEFVDFREFGNPIGQLERLNDWNADELIYIDITRDGGHDLRRDDHKIKRRSHTLEILHDISEKCFMPLTFGGRIMTLEYAATLIANGADKLVINTGAFRDPTLITQVAERFGSQCVVVGIDVKLEGDRHVVYTNQGHERQTVLAVDWASEVVARGAGEIFLNSIDRDGTANGYDIDIINAVAEAVNIPVIACGGAGRHADFVEVFQQTPASAVAAGNIFNFMENAYVRAKKTMLTKGCNVRPLTKAKER
ncbi:MAG: imidazole glycerol phosphate synthase cyclase subunit [Lentisphaeria bacterium]|jgi:cyclase|nr:imidazole glycerol phosphate synthase cyclase subunit [Lentisphaeria bacterium]